MVIFCDLEIPYLGVHCIWTYINTHKEMCTRMRIAGLFVIKNKRTNVCQ